MEIKSIATPLRKSTAAISVATLSEGNYPNGSAVLITDRIVATNSHVVEGKENPIITLYDLSKISGSVLDHHPEMDVSLILLDEPVSNNINPVSIAETRPVYGDKGFVIGHPFDLWGQAGAWQVASAISGYKTDQLDDRGDILFEGGGQAGMSGGPIFNASGKLVGINYASGHNLNNELGDYQDPHTTYYNPVVAPGVMNVIGVDVAGIRDLMDENSIFVSEHASPSSAFEIEYFSSNSGKVYSAEKSTNSSPSVKIKEVKDFKFSEVKNVTIPIDDNEKWSLLDFLNYDNGEYIVVNTYLKNSSVGVVVSKLKSSFESDTSFGSDGHVSELFTSNNVQKIIKSTIYNDKLYLLIQNSKGQQISYSVYTLDLNNPQSFVSLFESSTNITHKSHYFSKDFIVNSDGIFIVGTTDYAPSDVSQGKRTYDYFLAKYLLDGSISSSFADNGIFQKDFSDCNCKTDKAFTLDIQDDGKILIAGMTWVTFGGPDARVTRVNPDGTIDDSFGENGTTAIISLPPSQNHLMVDDRGREEATDLFVDDSGNIFLSGSKYMGFVHPYHGDLSASGGQYQSAIWKYDSSGKIIEDFGTYIYTNGKIPGLKTIEVKGNDKIQRLFNVNNQLLAFVATRDNISKRTSNKVFLINDLTGEVEIFASDEPTIYVPNPLKTGEDSPIENIQITSFLPDGEQMTYSIGDPSKASIIDNGDKTFTYTPNLNEYGSDSFVITFNVGETTITDTINVTISPGNDHPTISPSTEISINSNESSPTLTIIDIDGDDIISYSFGSPEKGIVIDNGDKTFIYT